MCQNIIIILVMMISIIIMMMCTRLKSIVFHDYIQKDADDDHQHFYAHLHTSHNNMHQVNKKNTKSWDKKMLTGQGHVIIFFTGSREKKRMLPGQGGSFQTMG